MFTGARPHVLLTRTPESVPPIMLTYHSTELPIHHTKLGQLSSEPRVPTRTLDLGLVGVSTLKLRNVLRLKNKYSSSSLQLVRLG